MKKAINLFALLAIALLISACQQKEKHIGTGQVIVKSSAYYTCSMHPQVHEGHPGNCPICGMKLIKVETTGNAMSDRIKLTSAQLQLANIQTDTVREENTGSGQTISGTVTADENATGELSARLAGRVQQLFIRTIGETVRIGQPVYSLYSEDLQEAEKEYLLAREQQQKLHNPDVDYSALINAAENKLKLWGLTNAQIAGLARSGKVLATTTITSTVSGTISELNIHEGDYVTEGMSLLKTQQLGTLWVEAQLYASESGALQLNQQITVFFPDQGLIVKGKVAFLNPELSDQSKVDLVRIAISNVNSQLRPGMQAYITTGSGSRALAVPTSSVLTDGKGSHVWIKNSDGSFSPQMVELGSGNQAFVPVTSGLKAGDIVVTNGTYLLNSESIFKNGQAMAGMKM